MVKKLRFGSAQGRGKDSLKATSPSHALWGESSPKFGDQGRVCGAECGAAGEEGRMDGCCIPIGPMTFQACLRPFLLLLHPAQLVFPLCPPLQYGVCLLSVTVSVQGAHGQGLWDVRRGMLRCFGEGECFGEFPPPENHVFTFFSLPFLAYNQR